jgi:hemerythrin
MLTWTPALSVGSAELDAQHQELFRRADAFLEALGGSSDREVDRLLVFLRDYARTHFADEEAWLRSVGYPDLEAHRAEHERFLRDLAVHAGGGALAIATWLVRWLHGHVVQSDGDAARFALARRTADGARG